MNKCLLLLLSLFYFLNAQNLTKSEAIFLYEDFMSSQEIAQGIPSNLLRAVSNVESGCVMGKAVVPWPWTINVEGKGYTFKTKEEAIKAVEKFQRRGSKSIDVGIMQINLLHHPSAFSNLQEAFDPQLNIAYGAKFLKQLFLQYKNWNKAVCHYHSATPKYHNVYRQKVMSQWANLCKNTKLVGGIQLAQTVLRFEDLEEIDEDSKKTKLVPQTSIRPFAKAKKVCYTINGILPARGAVNKPQDKSENASSKQFYSLD